MKLYGSKTGKGAYSVASDGQRITVDIAGHGGASFPDWQAAADHCRYVMGLHGPGPVGGDLPYFGAVNALSDILETGNAD